MAHALGARQVARGQLGARHVLLVRERVRVRARARARARARVRVRVRVR